MEGPLSTLTAALLGLVLGSLSLGGLLIQRLTGRSPAEVSAHAVGLENTMRILGAPVAVAAFGLDVLKGGLALAIAGGNPWAALGVFLGHLYPLPWLRLVPQPRGRGNGVLLGVLAGLWLFGGLPAWVVAAPVILYVAILAWTGYVALGTLGGLATLAGSLVIRGPLESLGLVGALLLLLGLWRHKSDLTRIADGTEARLGDPPPFRNTDPGVVIAAFMIHPMSIDDLWQPRSLRWLRNLFQAGLLPPGLVRRGLLLLRPQVHDQIRGIELPDGRELRVLLISGALLPEHFRTFPEIALRLAIQGAELARAFGAEVFGLGAYWSTIGEKGEQVQRAVPDMVITNGGAYTAGTVREAIPGLLERFRREGGTLRRATAAVVGASGVVAFGAARIVASEVGELLLIGRDLERLERSAATLRRREPGLRVGTSIDVDDVGRADIVITATSDPGYVIFPAMVKPGAWIYDLGRPVDVHPGVREVPGVHLVPGGVVRPPGSMRSHLDMHFGDGMVPACMAETMILAATRAFDRASRGPVTRSENISFLLAEGERLGFTIVTRDDRVAALEEAG